MTKDKKDDKKGDKKKKFVPFWLKKKAKGKSLGGKNK